MIAKNMFHLSILLLVLIFGLLSSAEAGGRSSRRLNSYYDDSSDGYGYRSTREEILATREHRKRRLEDMIGDMEEQLEDHSVGRRRLSEGERHSLERRMNVYRRKLETMQGDMDDRLVDRILAREDIRAELHRERMRSRGREL